MAVRRACHDADAHHPMSCHVSERTTLESNLAEAKLALDSWESAYHTAHSDVSRLEMELDVAHKRHGELEANALRAMDREQEMIVRVADMEHARVRWEEVQKRVEEMEEEKERQQEMINKMVDQGEHMQQRSVYIEEDVCISRWDDGW